MFLLWARHSSGAFFCVIDDDRATGVARPQAPTLVEDPTKTSS